MLTTTNTATFTAIKAADIGAEVMTARRLVEGITDPFH